MKLPIPLPQFTADEKKTLKRVLTYSITLAIAAVVIAWVVQMIMLKAARSQGPGMEFGSRQVLLEKNADALIDIDREAHEMAADHYMKIDQPKMAIDHLVRILPSAKSSQKETVLLNLATAYLASGDYARALAAFNQLADYPLDKDSLAAPILARRGLTLFFCGKVAECLDYLKACVSKYPGNAEAYCYLGQVEAAVKIPSSEAESCFQKAIMLNPSYVEARYQQARYLMNLKEYARSRDSLLQILRFEPYNEKVHSRLGMAYYYINEPQLARKSYETALLLNPLDFNAHYNLGEVYYTYFNDKKSALAEFKKTIDLKSDHAEANFKIGVICLANGMNKEAAHYLEAATEKEPTNTRYLLQLGVAFEQLGMRTEALQTYHSIAELTPLDQIAQQKIKLLNQAVD